MMPSCRSCPVLVASSVYHVRPFSALCTMVLVTKRAHLEGELASARSYWMMALILDCDEEDDALMTAEDDTMPDLLLLAALRHTICAQLLLDTSRDPYFRWPRSMDWFTSSLQFPDRHFRQEYRYHNPCRLPLTVN
jgi:hypothetical protein